MVSILIGVIVVSFSFTFRITFEPHATITIYFDMNGIQKRGPILPGAPVLVRSQIQDIGNWTTVFQEKESGPTDYLANIRFARESAGLYVSDGIEDGEYSIPQALNELWNEYVKGAPAAYDLTLNGHSFVPPVPGATAIIVERRTN